jgi:hypothetical protein
MSSTHSPVMYVPLCMHERGRSLIIFCPSQTLFISRTSQTQYHRKRYCSQNSPALAEPSEHSSLAVVFVTLIKTSQLPAVSSAISRLEKATWHHWPTSSNTRLRCRVCSSSGKRSYIRTICVNFDIGLCISGWFLQYHKKATFRQMTQEGSMTIYKVGVKK